MGGHWEEIAPARWRWITDAVVAAVARSVLPCPHVISDTMEPTEQVDGKFYTSKAKFRAVGRALGLIEVGTEKFKPKRRASAHSSKAERIRQLQRTIAEYKQGRRPRRTDDATP